MDIVVISSRPLRVPLLQKPSATIASTADQLFYIYCQLWGGCHTNNNAPLCLQSRCELFRLLAEVKKSLSFIDAYLDLLFNLFVVKKINSQGFVR